MRVRVTVDVYPDSGYGSIAGREVQYSDLEAVGELKELAFSMGQTVGDFVLGIVNQLESAPITEDTEDAASA
jgi:hypothetical protein